MEEEDRIRLRFHDMLTKVAALIPLWGEPPRANLLEALRLVQDAQLLLMENSSLFEDCYDECENHLLEVEENLLLHLDCGEDG